MSSFTNYSLFYFTELKYRLFYLFFNLFIVFIYFFNYINLVLLYLLKPIEFLNLEISWFNLSHFLMNLLFHNIYEINNIDFISLIFSSDHLLNDKMKFDYYPIVEINLNKNTFLYFYLFKYMVIFFLPPFLVYHLFLFFLPGWYHYEMCFFIKYICIYTFFFFILDKYIHFFFIYIYLSLTFNIYHELYCYEIDVEFNISDFLDFMSILLLLSYSNLLILLIYWIHNNNWIYKYIYIIYNIYMWNIFIVFFFYILLLYHFIYFFLFKSYLILLSKKHI